MSILRMLPGKPLVGCFVAVFAVSSAWETSNAAPPTEAQRLVAAAAQAEIAGDTVRHLTLLNDALQIDPENQAARWQLGQLEVDGNWLTAEELQRRAAADPLQTEYRELRSAAGANVADQLALARWCRKKQLTEEAELHWSAVLLFDRNNSDALKALDRRWKDGRLVSRKETDEEKQQRQATKDAATYWAPIIAKWRRAVGGRDLPAHDAALKEIQAIARLDSIPSIEAVTLGRDAYDMDHAEECVQIAVAFLDALANMQEQASTESLVRHAVFSPGKKARNAAIEKLKPRPQSDYVPLLLNGLAMPLESSFNVRANPDGSVFYSHSLYREGQDRDWSSELSNSAIQNDLGGRHTHIDFKTKTITEGPPNGAWPGEIAKRNKIASRYANRYANAAASTEAKVAELNASTEAFNAVIMQALAGTSGEKFETPNAWWDWWRDRNEYYESEERPVERYYYSDSDKYYYGDPSYSVRYPDPPPPPPGRRMSCFAKGTPVWTKTGQRPIETLALGDLVLAQHVETGELKYKPIIGITVRPPSAMLKINLDNDQITTTLGHPFWVAGAGWRMAKELDKSGRLHGVTGVSSICEVEPAPDAEAYNLVVAGFNTYFVGESGRLVHDNTPRRPTLAIVPGVLAK